MTTRRPYEPRPIAVDVTRGRPRRVGDHAVESIRERWLVEDRWWTDDPLRRHYFELVLAGGRCVVVFEDLLSDRWYSQR